MKINVTDSILGYDGKSFKGPTDAILNWRDVINMALNFNLPDEVETPENKIKAYALTLKAYDKNQVEYSIEEIAFILERIKKVYGALVVGRANEFFNNNETLEDTKKD